MKRFKKLMALFLSTTMILSTMSINSSILYAEDEVSVENDKSSIEDLTEEDMNKLLNGETVGDWSIKTDSQLVLENDSESDTEIQILSEDELQEVIYNEEINNDEPVGNAEPNPTFKDTICGDTSGLSFSSKELLIGTTNPSIFTWDTEVVSEYQHVYLTRFNSEEETKNAYLYYKDMVDFIAPNIEFDISDEESDDNSKADLSNINSGDDALATLNKLAEDLQKQDNKPTNKKIIALIDTGVNSNNILDSVSLIDNNSRDQNGHGTRMYNYIKDTYSDAEIISIKALDANGKGQVSDIYAAIKYAILYDVDIINLSMSAYSTVENEAITNIIKEATNKGILVVGSAGNNNTDTKYYIPGNIDEAIIAGSCDINGKKISTSNYGNTVDYYVVSNSTSEAAAKLSAYLASNKSFNEISSIYTELFDETEKDDIEWKDIDYFNKDFTTADTTITYNGKTFIAPDTISVTYKVNSKNDTNGYTGWIGTQTKTSTSLLPVLGQNIYHPGTYLQDGVYLDCGNYFKSTMTLNSTLGQNQTFSAGDIWCCEWEQPYNGGHQGTVTLGRVLNSDYYEYSNGVLTIPYLLYGVAHPTNNNEQKVAMVAFINVQEKQENPYYVAIKKTNENGVAMNNVTFDIQVTYADGTTISRTKKGYTGYIYNVESDSYRGKTTNGYGVLYLGTHTDDTKPTKVVVTENWTGTAVGYLNDWSTSIKANQFQASSNTSTLTTFYETSSAAIDAVDDASTWENETIPPGPMYFAFIKKDTLGRNIDDVYVNMTVSNGTTAQIKTGTFYNCVTKQSSSISNHGICVVYLGDFYSNDTDRPTSVTITENWQGSGVAWKGNVSTNVNSSEYTSNGISITIDSFSSTYDDAISTVGNNIITNQYDQPGDYYVALKKVDDEGYQMKNVTFKISVTGLWDGEDKQTTKTYTMRTGWSVNTTTGEYAQNTDSSKYGLATAYLGKFRGTPKVTAVENWSYAGYEGEQSKEYPLILYTSDGTPVNVGLYPEKYYTSDETQSLTAYTSVAAAISGAFKFTNTRKPYTPPTKKKYYMAIKKYFYDETTGEQYVLNNVPFSIEVSPTKREALYADDNDNVQLSNTVNIQGKYINDNYCTGVVSGYFTDVTTKETISIKEYNDLDKLKREETTIETSIGNIEPGNGFALVYLGKYYYAPDVELTEAWHDSGNLADLIKGTEEIDGKTHYIVEKISPTNVEIKSKSKELYITHYFNGSSGPYVWDTDVGVNYNNSDLETTSGELRIYDSVSKFKDTYNVIATVSKDTTDGYYWKAINNHSANMLYISLQKSSTAQYVPDMDGVQYGLYFKQADEDYLIATYILDKYGKVKNIVPNDNIQDQITKLNSMHHHAINNNEIATYLSDNAVKKSSGYYLTGEVYDNYPIFTYNDDSSYSSLLPKALEYPKLSFRSSGAQGPRATVQTGTTSTIKGYTVLVKDNLLQQYTYNNIYGTDSAYIDTIKFAGVEQIDGVLYAKIQTSDMLKRIQDDTNIQNYYPTASISENEYYYYEYNEQSTTTPYLQLVGYSNTYDVSWAYVDECIQNGKIPKSGKSLGSYIKQNGLSSSSYSDPMVSFEGFSRNNREAKLIIPVTRTSGPYLYNMAVFNSNPAIMTYNEKLEEGTFIIKEIATNGNYKINDEEYSFPEIEFLENTVKNEWVTDNDQQKVYVLQSITDRSGNQKQEYIVDSDDSDIMIDTPKKMYFAAVKKTDTNGNAINNVGFDLSVNNNSAGKITTGNIYNYDSYINGGKDFYQYIGTYNKTTKGVINEPVTFTCTSNNAIIRDTNDNPYTIDIARQDGVALVYLGLFEEAPIVKVKENWTDNAELVTGVKNNIVQVITVDPANYIKDTATHTLIVAETPTGATAASILETVENEFNGTIQVNKLLKPNTISGASPEGAEYTVTADPGQEFTYTGKCIIKADGTSNVLTGLKVGKYTVKETKGPNTGDWNLDTNEYPVEITATDGIKVINSPISTKASSAIIESTDTHVQYDFYISIKKDSSDANYKPSMAGIQYGLYYDTVSNDSNENLVATITLDKDGYIASVKRNPSWSNNIYKYIEVVTYEDDQKLYIHLQSDGSVDSLQANKFKLKEISLNGNTYYTINTNTSNIPAIQKDQYYMTTYTVADALLETPEYGSIQVHKYLDPDDVPGASPAGAEYTVTADDGQDFTYSGVCTILADGSSNILTGLKPGLYSIEETKAPTTGNWNIDTTIYHVEITTDGTTKLVESNLTVQTQNATIYSTDYETIIEAYVQKRSGLNNNSDSYIYTHNVTKKDNSTNCANENYSLYGTTYAIYNSQNELMGTVICDATGKSNTINLSSDFRKNNPTGANKSYYAIETVAGKNYKLNPNRIDFIVTKDNDEDNPYVINTYDDITTDPININLRKQDAVSGQFIKPVSDAETSQAKYRISYYPADVSQHYTVTQLKALDIVPEYWDITLHYNNTTKTYEADTSSIIPNLSMGYLTIEEIQAPTGFNITGSKYVMNLANESSVTLDKDEIPVILLDRVDPTNNVANIAPYLWRNNQRYLLREDNTESISITSIETFNPTWSSELISTSTNSHTGSVGSTDTLQETFTIKNVPANVTLTYKAQLFDVSSTESIHTSKSNNSNYVVKTYTSTGLESQDIVFDFGTFTPVAGHTYTSVVTIYGVDDNNDEVLFDTHNGNKNIELQKVYYPNLSTNLVSVYGNIGYKIGKVNTSASQTEVAKETVTFSNIPKDVEVTYYAELRDLTNSNALITLKNGTNNIITKTVKSTGLAEQSFDINFEYNSMNLAGHTLSAKVTAKIGDSIIAVHNANLDDLDETIYYMNGHTSAADIDTTTKLGSKSETTEIYDDFIFTNVVKGVTYKMTGTLHKRNKQTGADEGAIKDASNKEITKTVTFTINDNNQIVATGADLTNSSITSYTDITASGKIRVVFTVDSRLLNNVTVTAFETISVDDIDVFVHANINDKEQQIHFMQLATDLVSSATGNNVAAISTTDVVKDTLSFENIPYNTTVVFNGVLKDKATNNNVGITGTTASVTLTVDNNGNVTTSSGVTSEVTGIKDTNTNTVSGTIVLTYRYNSTTLKNKTLVSCVTATHNNQTVDIHTDMNDEREMIFYPDIHTNANDINTKSNVATLGTTQVVDTVTLNNLVCDKEYNIVGTVHIKDEANNNPILTINNSQVKKTATIIVNENGTVTLTNATNDNITVTNKVANGTIDIVFDVDTSSLLGKDIVVFESLQNTTVELVAHADINDEDQTIHIPNGGTTAIDAQTQDHVGTVVENDNIVLPDVVHLENIAIGHNYHIDGVVMDKSTGNKLIINNNEITSSADFTVSANKEITSNNTITNVIKGENTVSFDIVLNFTLNSKDLANKDVVIFETGYYVRSNADNTTTNVKIFEEKDITKLDQTVHFPNVRTIATDDTYRDHAGLLSETESITEKSILTNLIFSMEYEVKAIVMDQKTGNAVLDSNNNEVTKTAVVTISEDGKTVTAKEKGTTNNLVVTIDNTNETDKSLDITVEIPIVYNSEEQHGKSIVIFEDLYHNDIIVKSHHDITDKDEQIHYYELNIYKKDVDDFSKVQFNLSQNDTKIKFTKIKDGYYVIDSNGTIDILVPDSTGLVNIKGFNTDPYILTEIKTELGKNLLEHPISIQFVPSDDSNKTKLLVTIGDIIKTIENTNNEAPNLIEINIINNDVVSLKTGSIGTNIFYILAIILILMSISGLYIYKKKYR